MPVGASCRFDDNNPKYWHGCCHIRSAAMIIGTIQLICFLYGLSNSAALANRSQRYLNKYKNQIAIVNASDGSILPTSINEVAEENGAAYRAYSAYNGDPWDVNLWSENTSRYTAKPAAAAAADVTWHALTALAVVLMFYAIRFTRPYLMAPKFIFDAVSAGGMTVGAATLLSASMGRSLTLRDQLGASMAVAVLSASVHCYFFWISLRCFKYLMEKRAFMDAALYAAGQLPTVMAFELPAYGSGAADTPPAYPTVVQQGAAAKTTGGTKTNDSESTSSSIDDAVPPTYEEARRLQEQQTATVGQAAAPAPTPLLPQQPLV